MLTKQPEQILVIGPSWVGDMVMAQSLFIALKKNLPDTQIDVLAPDWCAALIDRMPEVRNLLVSGLQHGKLDFAQRWRLARQIKQIGYEQAIILANSLKSALIPWLAGIPKRTGFVGEQRWGLINDIRRLDKQRLPMTVQRFVALAGNEKTVVPGQVAQPELSININARTQVLNRLGLETHTNILALCPGAEFGHSKRWPTRHFATLAKHYLSFGWQVWLMGSKADQQPAEAINQLTEQGCQMLAGKTSLPEAIDLISLARLVVSNDSGLMHIAAALHRPLIALYGSTDPAHTPPLSDNHKILRLHLPCQPCFKRECPLQHHDCMRKLEPAQLIQAAQAL